MSSNTTLESTLSSLNTDHLLDLGSDLCTVRNRADDLLGIEHPIVQSLCHQVQAVIDLLDLLDAEQAAQLARAVGHPLPKR